MADYNNPLDEFRSYSYHFALTVANTSEFFRKMIEQNNGRSQLIDSINKVNQLGEAIQIDNSTGYLLIDTRRFSQFSVTDFQATHMFGTGNKFNPTTPYAASTMKVVDSTGFLFFNMMMDTLKTKLKTTRASAYFLLSVFFMGHADDGTTKTISTCFIPVMLSKLDMQFDSSGSVYDIVFNEVEGSPQTGVAGERLNYLGEVQSLSTSGFSNDLGGMFDSLERRLNVLSLAFYEKFNNTIDANNTGETLTTPYGRLVQYMIHLPKEWRKFKLSTAAKSKNKEQMFKSSKEDSTKKDPKTSSPNGTLKHGNVVSTISFSSTTTIADALKIILECSYDLLELASEKNKKEGKAIAFKTIVGTTSDENSMIVHFDIVPYYLPKIKTKEENSSAKTENVVKNLISYDYIFTGKNSQITDLKIQYAPNSDIAFDTNLKLGSARSAEVAAKGGQKTDTMQEVTKGESRVNSNNPDIKEHDPIFYAMKSIEQEKNQASMKVEHLSMNEAQQSLKRKQEYTQTYAELHFIGTVQMTMAIRGNSNLFRKYADKTQRGGIAPHGQIVTAPDIKTIAKSEFSNFERVFDTYISKGLQTAKEQYYTQYLQPKFLVATEQNESIDALMNNIDVANLPVYVKINIMAPNADISGNFISGESLFTNSFFFNGVYQLVTVESKFTGGDFSQHLTLIPSLVEVD